MNNRLFLKFILASFISQINPIIAMQELDDNDAIVRIWRKDDKNWGHVSLETTEYYMSFWPGSSKDILMGEPVSAVIMTSIEVDNKNENKPNCDNTICLNGRVLDCDVSTSKMNKSFEEFLLFNDVNSSAVKNKEYEQFNIKSSKWAIGGRREKEINPYSILISGKKPFYTFPQSCITFVLNILDNGITEKTNFFSNVVKYIPQKQNILDKFSTINYFETSLKSCVKNKKWN